MLRKLQDEEFCSAAHRKAYRKKQEEQALDFLLQSKPCFEPQPAPAPPTQPQPLPHEAGFVSEQVRAGAVTAGPQRTSDPVQLAPQRALLPARQIHHGTGLTCCPFVHASVPSTLLPADLHRSSVEPSPYPKQPPLWHAFELRPLWIEPPPKTQRHPSVAGIAKIVMRRIPLPLPVVAHAASALPFPAAQVTARAAMDLFQPAFYQAGSVRSAMAAPALAASQSSRGAAARQPACFQREPLKPPPLPPGIPGFPMSAPLSITLPAGQSSQGAASSAAAVQCSTPSRLAAIPSVRFAIAAPGLDLAPPAPVGNPKPLMIRTRQIPSRAGLISKFQVHLGARPRLRVIAPDFPAAEPAKLPQAGQVAPVPQRKKIRWRSAPPWLRRLAILVPASALLLAGAFQLATSARGREAAHAIRSRIEQRATIEFQDDFRSGLSHWTGTADWAKSWSYDPAGFVRPGRLALLDGTRSLADYRFEFSAEIGRKAVGWVFRATDSRSYYATKLIEMKRGSQSEFFIVRYAVIGGREQSKRQMPLPLSGSMKSLHRVREEVRGDAFTTYVDDQVVDTWADSSLARGGVGFFSDAGEIAYIRSVDVVYQDDLLGRLCSYLSWPNRR